MAIEQVTGQPVLEIELLYDQLSHYERVAAKRLLDTIAMLGGQPVGEVYQDQYRFPLVLRLPEDVPR